MTYLRREAARLVALNTAIASNGDSDDREANLKKVMAVMFAVGVAAGAYAAGPSKDLNTGRIHQTSTNANVDFHAGGAGGAGNLLDHGGEVMTNAKVVYIFWGWAPTTTDNYVKEVISFRDDPNAMMKHIAMLSQYRSTGSTSLKGTQPDVFDAVPPPTAKVTDTMVMAKVATSCATLTGGCRTDTIYEVLIPAGYYSDDGSGAQSCGGTNLAYCAYHGNGDNVSLGVAIKYSIQPYPSCSGCHGLAGWTAVQDEEHFIVHETREAMSDARLNAWYDAAGYEADDKCAWGQNLKFLFSETVGGHTYGYQMEYSNSARACVK
jgi:hypothetical protein